MKKLLIGGFIVLLASAVLLSGRYGEAPPPENDGDAWVIYLKQHVAVGTDATALKDLMHKHGFKEVEKCRVARPQQKEARLLKRICFTKGARDAKLRNTSVHLGALYDDSGEIAAVSVGNIGNLH